jgi:hypothetical protein
MVRVLFDLGSGGVTCLCNGQFVWIMYLLMISQSGEAAVVCWLSICLSAWLLCVRYLSVLDVDIFIFVNFTILIFTTSERPHEVLEFTVLAHLIH